MHKGSAFGAKGNPSMFDAKYLPPEDRDILVDYMADNFPADAPPKVIQLEVEPELDLAALKSAMFVEYIYREPEGKYSLDPWPHQVDFDLDGNVWLAYTQCCIVKFDPRTGEQTVFEDHGGGHGIAVDQTDGSVWYSGDIVRHLDPATGLVDHWKAPGNRYLGSNTQIFDSKGNLWLSLLGAGALGKWERETDTIKYWNVPVMRSRPYGIVMDHNDKVWFADYHNNGVTRFDPDTEEFKHFNLVKTNNVTAIRRLGADSKNMIWAGTWGNLAFNNSTLYKLNPDTEEVTQYPSGIPYGAIYNAEADNQDNIWIAPDNYVSKFDQVSNNFTHYPIPTRSDSLKTTITKDGGVWFIYRNAGKYAGYGGSAVVLYPNMDNITTLGAYHDENSAGYRLSKYKGPASPKAKGTDRMVLLEPQNAQEYEIFAIENGLINKKEGKFVGENPE
jgi:virginiamycin B lyase